MNDDKILEKQLIEIITNKEYAPNIILAKVEMLFSLGVDINTKHKGNTILIYAKENNLPNVAEFMEKHGAIEERITQKEIQKLTDDLVSLIDNNTSNSKEIKDLIDQGADVNIEGGYSAKYGDTLYELPLFAATRRGRLDIVELLLENNANINQTDNHSSKYTIMHQACYWGKKDIVEFLVEKGFDVNKTDTYLQTPILLATRTHHHDIVKYLTSKGANINHSGKHGYCVLEEICSSSSPNLELTKFLIDNGLNINIKYHENELTPLLHAYHNGYRDLAKLLIDNGADVNQSDINGTTPLMLVAEKDYLDHISILIDNGANPSAKNKEGKTAVQIAEENKNYRAKYKIIEKTKEKKQKEAASFFSRIKKGLFFEK